MIRTLFFWTMLIPLTVFLLLVGIPLSYIKADYLHSVGVFWAGLILQLAGSKATIEGLENIPEDQTVIFMPNHQSNFDIPALFVSLPCQFRWMAKKELFNIPLFGTGMKRADYIPVDRADKKGSMKGMADAAERIANGRSVVIFPEGTRSPDGNLLPFKRGGILLGMQSKVPIVPISISGSHSIMTKGKIWINRGDIRIKVHPAIDTAELKIADRKRLMAELKEAIESGLPQLATADAQSNEDK